jgi:tripartite-type tricarboxylate transporter receptor subunit TctC
MGSRLGQTIVIDNKPGASTIIGTEMLAKAAPDGYTLGLITDSHAINPMFFPRLPYDSEKDFELVSQLVAVPLVLLAHPSLNVKTVPELVALAKSRPGKLNYASIGDGSAHHLLMEWFSSLTGIRMAHIPYKGVAPALNDLLAGQVDVMISGTATLAQYTRSGKLVALGVTGAKREPSLPDVPTIAEQNVPRFEVTNLGFAIAAPAGTPRDVVVRLNQEIAAALAVPAVRDRLEAMGTVASPSSLADAPTIIARAVRQWGRIIKESGVKLNPAN